MSKKMTIKGYKVFNSDWTCRGFQYEVGKTFEEDVTPCTCNKGFHFCERASDCFMHYPFNPKNKVAEVIALGEVDTDGTKSCTNKIQIVREIPWDEVLRIVNEGKDCTGLCNTGDCNTGDWNTGDWNTGNRNTGNWNTGNWNTGNWNTGDCNTGDCNTGDRNTGDCNTGDWNTGNRNTGDCNTGDRNTGDWNTGDCNTGNRNTGDWNTGNRNTGDWNKTNFSSGCFCTEEQKIMLFNKLTDWTYRDWLNSDARYYLNEIPKNVVEWVCYYDMTDEEKAAHPEHETTGGYLKVLDEAERAQMWWDGLPEYKRKVIRELPNFDPDIFEQCTRIRV